MKINKRTIKYVLKHTDSTIDDLIKWFKGWNVKKYGNRPCLRGHNYMGYYTFFLYAMKGDTDRDIITKAFFVDDRNIFLFANRYVKDKQFRTEFLAELEKLREEFE